MRNALPSQTAGYDRLYKLINQSAACEDPIRVKVFTNELQDELNEQNLSVTELTRFYEYAKTCDCICCMTVIAEKIKTTKLQRRDPDHSLEKEAKNSVMREIVNLMRNGLLPMGASI